MEECVLMEFDTKVGSENNINSKHKARKLSLVPMVLYRSSLRKYRKRENLGNKLGRNIWLTRFKIPSTISSLKKEKENLTKQRTMSINV